MSRILACLALLLAAPSWAQLAPPTGSDIRFPRHPSLSPDGQKVAFSWQGDIWTVPVQGGAAYRITIHQAHDQYPAWSPDGRWIAFSSRREGNYDVWIVPANGGSARQLTFHTADDVVNGWSPDGSRILFASNREANKVTTLYLLDVKTGATRIVAEDIVPVNHGTFSPNGEVLYYTRGGSSTRKGYRGSGQSDLMARPTASGPGRYLVKSRENERWPVLATGIGSLYYVSDRDGTANLYRHHGGRDAEQLTRFRDGNVFFPSIAKAGDRIVFERDFKLWSLDLRNGAEPKPLSIHAPTDLKSNPTRRETYTSGVQEALLSPDGKQIAYLVHGELFVMPSSGGESIRLTNTSAREQNIAWSPDGLKVVFTSDRDGDERVYVVDAKSRATSQLTKAGSVSETSPIFSPDGKQIAFVRGLNGQELVVAQSQGGPEKVVASGPSIGNPAWSPDGKWLAFRRLKAHSAGTVANVFIVPTAGGSEINVTRYPVVNGGPAWSADGKRLYFVSTRTTQGQVWYVPLQDERNEPAEAEGPKPATPAPVQVKIDADEIHMRARQVTRVDTGVTSFVISPDSRSILYSAVEAGRSDLWRIAADGGSATRLTQSGESAAGLHFGRDGGRALYRSGGSIRSLSLAPPTPVVTTVSFSARMDVDIRAEMLQMFDEAWRKMRDGFYDEKMHGCDWNGLKARYRPVVADLTHKEDFYALFTLALGELNASHTGIAATAAGAAASGPATSVLGVVLDDGFTGPGVRIKSVLPNGPADREKSRLKAGDIVLRVDGESVGTNEAYYRLMLDRTGKTVELVVNATPVETGARTVKIDPISITAQKRLATEHWSKGREQRTAELSNGRLGYIHLEQMSAEQLERFRRATLGDLEEKDGVVLDIRFNGGGSIADEMFSILQARVFGYRSLRGDSGKLPAPMPAFTRPMIVLINESSFSNAEVFPWGFRALKLGKVVGVPTFGGVIGTGGTDLIDGSALRMPAVGSYTVDGQNMENNGCPPDILVELTPEDVHKDADPQLERAVSELLKQIDESKISPGTKSVIVRSER